MNKYLPEGLLIGSASNSAAAAGVSSLKDAMNQELILESRAALCDKEHNIHVNLGCMHGIIPRSEGALGIDDGSVRDIALISRVGKPVCFIIKEIRKNAEGRMYAVLSRKGAQEKCREEYVKRLSPGDVIAVKVSHMESFGVFCDIGAGISALLPIDSISVSRIPHPSARFFVGQQIRAVVKSIDDTGRVTLSHKELLGSWEENARLFSVGETVPGIIRSIESYGVFVELTPNLAGLAEYNENVREGQSAAVYIKNIIPERMKIKLVIVDYYDEKQERQPPRYFTDSDRLSYFCYSPAECEKKLESIFAG